MDMAKLLLVEDDEDNYDMLMRRLQRRDYEVVLAVDGVEAVNKAESERPDLILMGIKLPRQDGYEATRQIRGFSEGADVPVIALAAHALSEDKSKAKEAGCDDYHAKPVFFSELVDQIEQLLTSKAET
jgi:CheY-like chemotaxis protein